MATKTIIELVDDLDGGKADETVKFALDGVNYEIDLNEGNAKGLRDLLLPYVTSGRRVGGRKLAPAYNKAEDNRAIRDWARDNGIEVPPRGRIPGHIREQYEATR